MTELLLILTLFLSRDLMASNAWSCKEMSSERVGTSINACGIGHGKDEESARSKAFDSARAEFNRICQDSSDCIQHAFKAIPKRTTCDKKEGGFICHRMVSFEIGVSFATIQKMAQHPAFKNPKGNPGVVCAIGALNYLIAPFIIGALIDTITGHNSNPTTYDCKCEDEPWFDGCARWRAELIPYVKN